MDSKQVFLALFLVFTLIISGCGSSSEVAEDDYRHGTRGVEISFAQNTPSKFYMGDPFDLIVQVENKGAPLFFNNYNAQTIINLIPWLSSNDLQGTPIYVTISGPSAATNIPVGQPLYLELEGRSNYLPENGGYGEVYFTSQNNDLSFLYQGDGVKVPSPNANYYKSNLQATVCYLYTTLASETVCIDPNPRRSVKSKQACTPQENIGVGGGQGGPVAVTSIKQHLSSDRVTFRITIKNLDSGTVFYPTFETLEYCALGAINHLELNKVAYEVDLGGEFEDWGNDVKCFPEGGIVRLQDDGSATFSCTFYFNADNTGPDPLSQFAYTDQLGIQLDYGYSKAISKQIEIVNIEG